MTALLYVLGIASYVVGLIGIVAPGIPGGILLAIGVALAAWAEDFTRIGWITVVVAVVVSVIITLVDVVAALAGAKLGGGTKWGLLGASVGLIAGFFLGPLGIIVGPAVGAILFEYWKNPDADRALKAGAGVALAWFAGIVVKLSLALILLGIAVFDWLR